MIRSGGEFNSTLIVIRYRPGDSLFQCRQCQDLLENNLARKRPIEVLVGKKNLEVRPLAVSKGEIVKRILFKNPDAEFIFCAGDDKVMILLHLLFHCRFTSKYRPTKTCFEHCFFSLRVLIK